MKEILSGLHSVARSLRRGVVATCAAVALILLYGIGSIGSHIISAVGISGLALATTTTPAMAQRGRGRGRGRAQGKRRRKQGRKRQRRRRGNRWEWYYVPSWYYW